MVPASEVEETDFAKSSTQWTHFFRAGEQTIHPPRSQSCRREMYAETSTIVVEGPPDSPLSLTGIGFHDSSVRAVVPASPEQACIVAPSCTSHGKRQYKMFSVRGNSLIPLDINYRRLPFRYPVHAQLDAGGQRHRARSSRRTCTRSARQCTSTGATTEATGTPLCIMAAAQHAATNGASLASVRWRRSPQVVGLQGRTCPTARYVFQRSRRSLNKWGVERKSPAE
jgi:hypothetical protein